MKHIRSVVALVLVAALLCGCGAGVKMEDLTGKWALTAQHEQEEATYLLDMLDLYAEERALVDLNSMTYVLVAEFGPDGSYSFAYEVEANKECVRQFYMGVMDALYEGRATLSDVYETDLESMSREEFNQFYADVYGVASYEFLMDRFVEYAYDYDALAEPVETGTFKIVGKALMCTITGETEAESLGCELEGDTLKLTYADGSYVDAEDGKLSPIQIILISLGIGAVVGGIAILVMRSSMKTARPQRSAVSYIKEGTYRH